MIKKLCVSAISVMALASTVDGSSLYQFANRRVKLNKIYLKSGSKTYTYPGGDILSTI